MRIAKEIVQEVELADSLIYEGFNHMFKAGELIQEVESMLHSEGELQEWLQENCSGVDKNMLQQCRRLSRGENVIAHVNSRKAEEKGTKEKEPQKRKRLN